MIQQAIFLVLAAITLSGAIGVVTSRSVFISALWLILSFVGVAGLYVLLEAGFLAVVQLLIYVGAISVLILFTIMLTRQVMGGERMANRQWYIAAPVALAVFGMLATVSFRADWPIQETRVLPASGGVVVVGQDGGLTLDQARQIGGTLEETDAAGQTVVRAPGPVAALGRAFVIDYLLAFEVISAILLVALVGAVVIARE